MEKFNSALSIIFYVIWIPLGILLAIVLFLFLSSNMGKTQMTSVPQGNFMQGTGDREGQVQQPGGGLQQSQEGKQPIPQVSGAPKQSPGQEQQNPQPPLQK